MIYSFSFLAVYYFRPACFEIKGNYCSSYSYWIIAIFVSWIHCWKDQPESLGTEKPIVF